MVLKNLLVSLHYLVQNKYIPQSSKWFIKYAIHSSDLNQVELLRTVFKKRIVSDLVSDLGVSIWSLGTEPETNWIRLNIMWNLSRVSHIRLNFQFIKVLLFKDLVGVQSEILWKGYLGFFVFPTYTQKHTPKYKIHKNQYQIYPSEILNKWWYALEGFKNVTKREEGTNGVF